MCIEMRMDQLGVLKPSEPPPREDSWREWNFLPGISNILFVLPTFRESYKALEVSQEFQCLETQVSAVSRICQNVLGVGNSIGSSFGLACEGLKHLVPSFVINHINHLLSISRIILITSILGLGISAIELFREIAGLLREVQFIFSPTMQLGAFLAVEDVEKSEDAEALYTMSVRLWKEAFQKEWDNPSQRIVLEERIGHLFDMDSLIDVNCFEDAKKVVEVIKTAILTQAEKKLLIYALGILAAALTIVGISLGLAFPPLLILPAILIWTGFMVSVVRCAVVYGYFNHEGTDCRFQDCKYMIPEFIRNAPNALIELFTGDEGKNFCSELAVFNQLDLANLNKLLREDT